MADWIIFIGLTLLTVITVKLAWMLCWRIANARNL